jgi:hypothetical protein
MDDPAREEAVLKAALAKASPEQVAALLAHVASPDLLRQLHELAAGAGPPEPAPTADAPAREEVGAQIGPYRLLQELGEGGMGTVFLAEQQHAAQRCTTATQTRSCPTLTLTRSTCWSPGRGSRAGWRWTTCVCRACWRSDDPRKGMTKHEVPKSKE